MYARGEVLFTRYCLRVWVTTLPSLGPAGAGVGSVYQRSSPVQDSWRPNWRVATPLLGQDWALGRAGGAMGHMAGCPAPSSGFWLSILKALVSLLWGWGLTEVVTRLPWSCEGSPKEAGWGWGWPGAWWAGLPGSEAHLPCWRPPAGRVSLCALRPPPHWVPPTPGPCCATAAPPAFWVDI